MLQIAYGQVDIGDKKQSVEHFSKMIDDSFAPVLFTDPPLSAVLFLPERPCLQRKKDPVTSESVVSVDRFDSSEAA